MLQKSAVQRAKNICTFNPLKLVFHASGSDTIRNVSVLSVDFLDDASIFHYFRDKIK